jgi:hypothetical protein
MKTYFLALNKSDFNISGSTWTSNPIDLYSNRFYTNYSTFRSKNGLNELGDFTFVGTEILPNATPTIEGSTKVTNFGEIVVDTDPRSLSDYSIMMRSKMDTTFLIFKAHLHIGY